MLATRYTDAIHDVLHVKWEIAASARTLAETFGNYINYILRQAVYGHRASVRDHALEPGWIREGGVVPSPV
jgi:hypothetical protein